MGVNNPFVQKIMQQKLVKYYSEFLKLTIYINEALGLEKMKLENFHLKTTVKSVKPRRT